MKKNRVFGFTIIEILIALAIIAMVAGVFFFNFFSSLARGRDSRRKQDLRSLVQALEIYYNDNSRYPDDLPAAGAAFTHPSDPSTIYLKETPADPRTEVRYCYESPGDGSWFAIAATLENNNDPDAAPTTCGGSDYNYGVSSPNINL